MPTVTLAEVKKTALKECPFNSGFKIGDKVTFTNDYGVVFPGHEIIGFTQPGYENGGWIYLDLDCYWFPVRASDIKKAGE